MPLPGSRPAAQWHSKQVPMEGGKRGRRARAGTTEGRGANGRACLGRPEQPLVHLVGHARAWRHRKEPELALAVSPRRHLPREPVDAGPSSRAWLEAADKGRLCAPSRTETCAGGRDSRCRGLRRHRIPPAHAPSTRARFRGETLNQLMLSRLHSDRAAHLRLRADQLRIHRDTRPAARGGAHVDAVRARTRGARRDAPASPPTTDVAAIEVVHVN